MTEKGNIEKIFSEGFQDFRADVDTSVWNGIESNLQSPGPAPANPVNGGLSVAAKTIIGLTAAIVTAGVIYFSQNKKENTSLSESLTNQVLIKPQQPNESLPDLNSQNNTAAAEMDNNQNDVIHNSGQKPADKPKQSVTTSGEAVATATDGAGDEGLKTPAPEQDPGTEIQPEVKAPVKTELSSEAEKKESSDEHAPTEQQHSPAKTEGNTKTPSYKPFPFKYNIITPNGDGNNDIYTLDADGLDLISVEAFILDKNGRRVGMIKSLSDYWDGKDLRGNMLPNGIYRIIVSATGADGTNYKGQKEIILNR